ncbi:MAG: hypothetical protein IJR49_03680, partial [Treponema sp.]|nr:hypothetical protein [Treponema sp.]
NASDNGFISKLMTGRNGTPTNDSRICALNNNLYLVIPKSSNSQITNLFVYSIDTTDIEKNNWSNKINEKLDLKDYISLELKCRDAIILNNYIYILIGKADENSSKGAIIKINIETNGNLTFVEKYGLSNNDTAENEEDTCFYNPVRFLGTYENGLIIADDGRTKSGIQKNRVIFFNTQNNSFEKIVRTNAGFLGDY